VRLFSTRDALSSVGRYGLKRVLGTGPSGTVYVGFDPETGREVAINLMVVRRDRQERIVREAQAWAQIDHPQITAIHEVGSFEDPLDGRSGVFIVRELVHGMDMQRWLDALTQPAHAVWGRVLEMFIEAGTALSAAHAHGLVHRGLCPESLVVGYDTSVKVLDFSCIGGSPLHDGGVSMGALAYAAPEVQDGREATAASDQYSFCATLFTALRRVLGERTPKRIVGVLARGMAPDPHNRYPTMDDLLHALNRQRGGLIRRTIASFASATV
jgi:serine/threonine protein kinase